MKLNKKYIQNRDKWWGLPLILPSLLQPLVTYANTYAHVGSGEVVLFYLPLALMMSLMLFFGWAALPGIVLSILLRKLPLVGLSETLTIITHYLVAIVLSWGAIVSLRRVGIMSLTGFHIWSFRVFFGRYFFLRHYFWFFFNSQALLEYTKTE